MSGKKRGHPADTAALNRLDKNSDQTKAGFRLAEESRKRMDSLGAAPVKAVNPLLRQEEDSRKKGRQGNAPGMRRSRTAKRK